ncbi:MAG: hypothetical protein B7Y36_06980 [Novosphingobium sp. 28-62-57]|nr:MAG: hypothetical protein B7Z34_02040 [Novosphingobium sp. 12-62-10]OYZ11100.1 MAG: hypothetical protein B7Y36_06980 [Novosphingobium sp. 28-62-57]OZA35887.1 MAG: hypothetical protein B7X92_08485 [Novosphingobium sp. 17-62-9]
MAMSLPWVIRLGWKMWSKRWPATTDASQNAAMHRTWFFFYGTLSEDHDNPVNHAMLPLMEGSWRATVRGALRAVRGTDGWYPVLCAGRGRVAGRLYRSGPRFSARHLRSLDAYETYNPRNRGRSEYVRRAIRVRVPGRGWVMAQAYLHNRPCHPGLTVIARGDFTAWQRQRGLRAFGCGEN